MPLLDDRTPQDWRQRAVPALQVAGLLFTGWIMWRSANGLQWVRVPVPWLILRATIYVLLACLAGAFITLVLFFAAAEWEPEDAIRATFRASSAAVWFAPCVILLTQLSPAAVLPAIVLVVNATHMLYIQWRIQQPAIETSHDTSLFASAQLPARRFLHDFGPGLAVSTVIQAGICAVLLQHPALAGLCLACGVSLATLLALASRAVQPAKRPSMPRAIMGLALTVLLAIGMTLGGTLMQREGSGGDSFSWSPKPAGPPGMPGSGRPDLPDAMSGTLADNGFPGVILWPEIKPIPTLIAPMPQTTGDGSPVVMQHPLSIPFSGEYWMYRWPYARPPKTSFFQRGTPSALSFSSTDHRPLMMEARHKLDQTVSLSCCRAVRLEIRNADRYPDTITLDLVLIDNELPGAPQITIGHANVTSRPDTGADLVKPVNETLEFPMPPNPTPDAFDEFRVVFQRARSRADKSAKVSIERFILVP
ncbi:MAG: hypothetical protein ABI759_14355 [Candidatus Solibacter sp.]